MFVAATQFSPSLIYRLGHKWEAETYTLIYDASLKITAVKRFIVEAFDELETKN